MAYYIISHDPESMGQFQERFEFLREASWINETKFLKQLLPSGEVPYFFVSLGKFDPELDNNVMWIKQHISNPKIIYIYDKNFIQDLNSHQGSPFAGDLYVDIGIDQERFFGQLELIGLTAVDLAGNKLEMTLPGMVKIVEDKDISAFKNHPISNELNKYLVQESMPNRAKLHTITSFKEIASGDDMSDKDQELSLDNLGDLEISDDVPPQEPQEDAGLDLSLGSDDELALTDEVPETSFEDSGLDLLSDDTSEELDDLETPLTEEVEENADLSIEDDGLNLSDDIEDGLSDINLTDESEDLNLSEDNSNLDELFSEAPSANAELNDIFSTNNNELNEVSDDLSFADIGSSQEDLEEDLSEDALEKLKEIDEIMVLDASQAAMPFKSSDLDIGNEGQSFEDQDLAADLDQPLVSDDLNLDGIDFPVQEEVVVPEEKEVKKKKIKEEFVQQVSSSRAPAKTVNQELKEISGAYSGEMERLQATISNLRQDREELLAKIQKLEEEKMLSSRQNLSLRAELDEKKIELTIIRKKLNEDLIELRDRLRIQDEKKLIQEEKIKQMKSELDKVDQKNKIDLRKVQMREKELEQKLELLKADSETQIRNRDLKILELKRKIDTMEFDMESISSQEKRSVESRFELEDKLDKAIKTLRSAISVLEEETDKASALEALKKNIEM